MAPIVFVAQEKNVGLHLADARDLEHGGRSSMQVGVIDEGAKRLDPAVAQVLVGLLQFAIALFDRLPSLIQ